MPDDSDMTLRGRLPAQFPLYDDSVEFAAWLDSHQSELDQLSADLEEVKNEIHIGTATGQELDLIGEEYGLLGRRRGRDDASYRSYLMSLIASFQGVGTTPGIKQAVSSGLLVDEDSVRVLEDFAANKYEIELTEWTPHRTGTIRTLADLADPVAIARRDPVHYRLDIGVAGATGSSIEYETRSYVALSAGELPALSEGDIALSRESPSTPTHNVLVDETVFGTAEDTSTATLTSDGVSSSGFGTLSSGPNLA